MAQPNDGGVATCVRQLVVAALDRAWQVGLACPPGPLADLARADGAEVFDWRATRHPGVTVVRETIALKRIVTAWRPDVVHLHSSKAGLAGRLALRGRPPTVFQPHAWSFEALGGPTRTLSLLWERSSHRWADLVVCVSDGERARGIRAGVRARYAVAVNGVDLASFPMADAGERTRARRELRLAEQPTVVCVGRLCRQKGQDLLLDAWPAVLTSVPHAVLALVGDGPDRPALEARGPARTVFAGHADPVWPWLAAADVVALPSRWEGHALVLLEAMAAGRSVVAADVAGAAETVGGDAGELVPADDPSALAAALVRHLVDPVLSGTEGAAGRARVQRDFDARTTVGHMLDLICELVDQVHRA